MTSLPDDLLRIADSNSDLTEPERATIRLAAQALRWVPVGERLPEPGRQVVCAYRRSVFAGFNLGAGEGWWDENGSHTEVDHWMPLPEPPQ